ncbi:thioesterase family protein [Acinetobacter chinensis]|uniref:Thioesterase family protein n=1 Tax=Acinetobacter chinensis TaxID=2004650 RepID=A0ABU3WAH6_9GAMM|nr:MULTISPECIES: thioesterase family protein [Acinetobacter]AXY61005.1 thioesterase family protein [Acinetobacter sp. WCHAc010052]MDV2467416.1 thioesterase family protein [Acinetobacter chinensis]WOE40995.1 thioesterase family protein [Acinetobacter chinensis]
MTNESEKSWTGNIHLGSKVDLEVVFKQLCKAFNSSPFFGHNSMTMRVVDGQIETYVEMKAEMIGNVAFQILHGGVAATVLDSIGGITAMGELYKRSNPDELADTMKKVSRLATVDMRVDYLAPGRGKYFIARAETLRMGRKGCTMRMTMVNDEDKPIATAIASYAY